MISEVDFQVVEQHANRMCCGVAVCTLVELLFYSFVFPATLTKYVFLGDFKGVLCKKVLFVEIQHRLSLTAQFCGRISFTYI